MENRPENSFFDVEFARKQFPFFDLERSKEWAFFDNAGGTFPCRQVVDKLHHFYTHNKVQPYGDNALANEAGKQMDKGRKVIADLLGVSQDCITIGPSTTQNLNTLSMACQHFLKKDDEIIISEQDHEANIGGWERVAKQTGALLNLWKINTRNGELDINDLEHLLNDKTKILCVTHSSNIVGTVNPIEDIIELGHKFGAKVVIDGVSFAPHKWPDLSSAKADAYCFSTYKTYATHLGIMYVAPQFLGQLGFQCHFFNAHRPWSVLDSAGPDHASIAALAGLEEYFTILHDHHFGESEENLNQKAVKISKLMNQHELSICKMLIEKLNQLPVRIIGRPNTEGREANISFASNLHSSLELTAKLSQKGISTKNGHFYAYRIIDKLGFDIDDGVVRLSFAHYNTKEETQKLVDAFSSIYQG